MLAAFGAPGAALAQSTETDVAPSIEGVLNAVSYKPLPSEPSFTVRPWDNSNENMALAKDFEDQLKQRGFVVAADAPIVLSFETRDVLGRWSDDRSSVVELHGRAGTATDDEAQVLLNLFRSEKGGVFNKGKTPDEPVPSSYSLEVRLDLVSGGRLWQGEAMAKLRRTDSRHLVRSMIPTLLDNMGTTVRAKPFAVR